MNSAKWIDDAYIVAELARYGWKLTPADGVSTSLIDIPKSLENVGRTGRRMIPGSKENIRQRIRDEHEIKRLILWKMPNGLYLVVSGLHRIIALHEEKVRTVCCYLINAPFSEAAARVISMQCNLAEGQGIYDHKQLLAEAMYQITECGADPAEIANALGIKLATIQSKLRAREARIQCLEAGFKGDLPESVYNTLRPLKSSDNVMLAAASHIAELGLSGEDVKDFVKSITRKRTEATKLQQIEQEAKRKKREQAEPSAQQPSPQRKPLRKRVYRLLHGLINILDSRKQIEDIQIERNSEDHEHFKTQVQELEAALKRLCS